MAYTCTKTFDCVSTAHRNWRAASNPNRDSKKCSYIHGYTKTFTFVFGCKTLDEFQWVYDYGTTSSKELRTMTKIKNVINDTLDHAVTTDSEDPMLAKLYEMHDLELIKLVVIPVENGQSGSVEGLCRYLYNTFDPLIKAESGGRVWIESVTISEHHKNSSTYTKESHDYNIPFKESPVSNMLADELANKIMNDNMSFNDAKDFVESEKQEQKKKNTANDFLETALTKENIEKVLRLMTLHPKYKAIATSLLLADNIKDAVMKNPQILDFIKGKIKRD